ncbi:hypothetical protein CMUS01_05730 [Colletotrichum musicola]|uniref:Nephrocystin 3-like N-terminal domain-containing protein n=1 Tax=Colletotrichum musicola TaxID=2175873 RepID=A0A8H6KQQ0_9PEZI|nr:hypothetical protein CMUS01_05730 [Colletotrichum musicola]
MASSTTLYDDEHARPPRRKHTFHDDDDDGYIQSSKRQRTFLNEPHNVQSASVNNSSVPRHEQYTVAWICALHIEMAAAEAMLDEAHDTLLTDAEDTNTYTLGRVGSHNVVIAGLPTGQYGTNNAANVVSNLKKSFPSIRVGLMVGIGGGAPSKCDIRLGDVVGTRVMQCDLRKSVGGVSISMIVEERFEHNANYRRPTSPDELFPATYEHLSTNSDCSECDLSTLVPRAVRDCPSIHYGAIASGNQVMRSASQRDSIAQELDIICFEMEAAGIMDVIPRLPIRGICDHADSHKNKIWQKYAAATAAAYARELLAVLSTSETRSYTHFEDSSQNQMAIERKQLLEVLKFDQLESREKTIKAAHAKTCQWLLEDPNYRARLDPEKLIIHDGFLWIRGKPGAGKSTIMKFAYSNMRKRRRKETVTAAFFFNARGESLERSVEGMYRSLLIQVLQGFPELQLLSSDDNPITEPEDACPPLEVLKELFQSAVLSLGQRRLTCFIDALDECDEQQVIDMIETFEDLAERSTATGIPFRVCFSSRHYPYITIRKGVEFTLENRPGHSQDLANYATSRFRVTDANLSSELKHELVEKASGVFLWLALVVDILNKEYARGGMALRKTLEKIPSDLHDLFKDMLRRDDANKEQLLLSVLWILCARRPLHPSEFSHAIWAGVSLQGLADTDPPDVKISDTDMHSD